MPAGDSEWTSRKTVLLNSKNTLHLGETEVTDQGHFKQKNRVATCVY